MNAVNYYSVQCMDCPTPEMYGVNSHTRALLVGTARRQGWAFSIDIDPDAPADMTCDGRMTPFHDKVFDVVILDFTTNFMPPSHVEAIIQEAHRIGKEVKGRCHVSPDAHTLRGAKQAHCHKVPPVGVEWVEIREHPPRNNAR